MLRSVYRKEESTTQASAIRRGLQALPAEGTHLFAALSPGSLCCLPPGAAQPLPATLPSSSTYRFSQLLLWFLSPNFCGTWGSFFGPCRFSVYIDLFVASFVYMLITPNAHLLSRPPAPPDSRPTCSAASWATSSLI